MQNSTSGFRIEDVVRSTMQKPSEDYLKLGDNFGNYHKDPANVLLHFVSTPLGLVGAISLLRTATNSSSVAMSVVFFYLLSLLPIVPNGDFYGTALFCGLIVLASRLLKLGTVTAVSLIVIGYMLQDLSHLATGEATFQSTYSEGGSVSYCISYFNFPFHTYHSDIFTMNELLNNQIITFCNYSTLSLQ